MSPGPTPTRRVGIADAVVIGMGSMIGAGVFAAFAPAAAAAGVGLLVGLVIAAVVAYCNATAVAHLAAQYPQWGGTYVYGREQLGDWWGFLAGWGFVIGKSASCAAMSLTFAAYVVPPAWQRPVAAAAVIVLAAINYRGVTRTVRLTRVLLTMVLVALGLVVVAGLTSGRPDPAHLTAGVFEAGGGYGVLQSAGLLFFAFAGYARIATMGEEVRDPQRTIPRAIALALAATVVCYALVGVTALLVLGPQRLAHSDAALVEVVRTVGWDGATVVVAIGAAAASLGALLVLEAGVARTVLAMARRRDLPMWLAAVHPRYQVPHRAEVALAGVVSVLVLIVDLRNAIGFSSFGVLVYYLIANLSAFVQGAAWRRSPRSLQLLGAVGCLALVATLPWEAVLAGVGMFVSGVIARAGWRLVARRRSSSA